MHVLGTEQFENHVFEQLVFCLAKRSDTAVYWRTSDCCVWSLHGPAILANSNFPFSYSTKISLRGLKSAFGEEGEAKMSEKVPLETCWRKVSKPLEKSLRSPCFLCCESKNDLTIELDPSQRFLTQSLLWKEAYDSAENNDIFLERGLKHSWPRRLLFLSLDSLQVKRGPKYTVARMRSSLPNRHPHRLSPRFTLRRRSR